MRLLQTSLDFVLQSSYKHHAWKGATNYSLAECTEWDEVIGFRNKDPYLATFKARSEGKPLPGNFKGKYSRDY